MYDVKPVTTEHSTSCGPACLKMLLDYYGKESTLEDLIAECGVGVAGCKATDVLRVGRKYGLDMTSWQMDPESALTVDRPVILWWRYQHFVVFCGLNDKGEPVICNPSSGRFPISRATFDQAFSGVALCNGTPEDYVPRSDKNYAKDEVFKYSNETYIALRPISHGERIAEGWNCKTYSIVDAMNAKKKEDN